MGGSAEGRSPGRPRSERAGQAIITATLDLLAEEAGVAGVSIEAVAARAGVGKSTIYRRWPNKEALIIGAMAALKPPLPPVGGDSVREDLVVIARALLAEQEAGRSRGLWRIMSSAEKYPELLEGFQRQVLAPRREQLEEVLRRGARTGELRGDLDPELALRMIIGALTFRSRAPSRRPPDPDLPERVVDLLLSGLEPRLPPSMRS